MFLIQYILFIRLFASPQRRRSFISQAFREDNSAVLESLLTLVLLFAELMELVPVSRSQTALNPLDNEGQIPENKDEEVKALLKAIDGTLLSLTLNYIHKYKYNSSVASTLSTRIRLSTLDSTYSSIARMNDVLSVTELSARLNQLLLDYNLPITKIVRP